MARSSSGVLGIRGGKDFPNGGVVVVVLGRFVEDLMTTTVIE